MKILVIGRFQPFHKGHLKLIKEVYSKQDNLKIIIGSKQESFTSKNPFTYIEREEMIKNSLLNEKVGKFEIEAIEDKDNDYEWLKGINKIAGKFDVCYSGNKIVVKILKRYNETVVSKNLFNREKLSGRHIRKLIQEGKKVENLLPQGTLKTLKKIDGFDRVKNISKTKNKRVFTIGHSNRKINEFIQLLEDYQIKMLVDVRTMTKSKNNPQFESSKLRSYLKRYNIQYLHIEQLGGLRKPNRESPNKFWINYSFRGYADYMKTKSFYDGIKKLIKISSKKRTAIMCAEALPWRCHRFLISDFLVYNNYSVTHIISRNQTKEHRINKHAVFTNNAVVYR